MEEFHLKLLKVQIKGISSSQWERHLWTTG